MVLVISFQVESVSFEELKAQVKALLSKVVNIGKYILIFYLNEINFSIVNSFTRPISCYECIGCETVDSNTPKKMNCSACMKAVLTSPIRHVSRGCVPSCQGHPRQPGLELNCCESELCNSTSHMKSNLKLICFTLLVFIITKSIYAV
ncbi:unnamed protein product [Trichobilharzia regenti]|nr:unnamed protein product [Trichobilharzia regenti]